VRAARWILISVAVVVLLFTAAAVILAFGVNPNRYKPKIESIVGDLTGMPFKIDGDLRIKWFPWLRLQVGPARLGGSPGSGGPDLGAPNSGVPGSSVPGSGVPGSGSGSLLEWQSAQVGARLIPLLRGEFEVDRIVLEGPRIHLRRDVQGRVNWEPFLDRWSAPPGRESAANPGEAIAASAEQRARPAPGKEAGSGPGGGTAPQIGGIEIRDGALDYADDMSGIHLSVSAWQFQMGAWTPGATFPLHTKMLVKGDSLPAAGVTIQMDTPKLTLAMAPVSVTAPELAIHVNDAKLEGKLSFDQTRDAQGETHSRGSGSLAVAMPSVRRITADFLPDTSLPKDPSTLGRLELSSDWTFADGAVTVRPLTMRLDGVTFTGWMERSVPPVSEWSFELHGDRIDLGRYMVLEQRPRKKPFELPIEAFRSLRANGSLIFDQAQWADAQMKDVRLRLQTAEQHR